MDGTRWRPIIEKRAQSFSILNIRPIVPPLCKRRRHRLIIPQSSPLMTVACVFAKSWQGKTGGMQTAVGTRTGGGASKRSITLVRFQRPRKKREFRARFQCWDWSLSCENFVEFHGLAGWMKSWYPLILKFKTILYLEHSSCCRWCMLRRVKLTIHPYGSFKINNWRFPWSFLTIYVREMKIGWEMFLNYREY